MDETKCPHGDQALIYMAYLCTSRRGFAYHFASYSLNASLFRIAYTLADHEEAPSSEKIQQLMIRLDNQ